MANPSSAAKYQLFTITKNNKTFPLQSKVTSFDYYESLLSPNITATMTFVDSGLVEKGDEAVRYNKEYDKQERPGTLYNALPIVGDGSEEIRFKISSPQLNHEIEIFKINDIDFMASVNRFHLGCVRGCYNGETVNMISSCKDALLTNINYDFRYSSGERHPCEITNKYMSRGQSIILNKTELEHTIEYNKIKDNHNGMFKLEGDDNKLLGPKLINNDMFKHLKYYDGLPDDLYIQVEENGFVTSEEEFYKAYKMICGYEPDGGIDFLKFKTINKDGNIEPVKMWLIDAAYEYFF